MFPTRGKVVIIMVPSNLLNLLINHTRSHTTYYDTERRAQTAAPCITLARMELSIGQICCHLVGIQEEIPISSVNGAFLPSVLPPNQT